MIQVAYYWISNWIFRCILVLELIAGMLDYYIWQLHRLKMNDERLIILYVWQLWVLLKYYATDMIQGIDFAK